jgi:uncharacterized protein YndB with AHSA1/START domain
MPTFDDSTTTRAVVEEVWKLLYDPARFPEWWEGIETIEPPAPGGEGDFTMYPAGYPDFPMPQALRADGDGRKVTISCLVSDLVFAWRLEPLAEDEGTRIMVHVEIPEAERQRLDAQRGAVSASLRSLAALAGAERPPSPTDAPPARG